LKEELLQGVARGRAREADFESLCVDTPADPAGRWSAKDHLAHLAWWRDRNARLMDGVRTGHDLPPPVEDDTQNAIIYQDYRDRPLAAIRAEARRSWDRLTAAIEACTEADLMKPHPYAEGRALWESVPGNAHGHLAEHLMFWYLETGDESSAEASQLWLLDVEGAISSSPRPRAFASYNLACFYGRIGRAKPALPPLREAFEGAPDLVEWARQDTDLDRIRDDGEIAALLGG
jgi:DinB family protein